VPLGSSVSIVKEWEPKRRVSAIQGWIQSSNFAVPEAERANPIDGFQCRPLPSNVRAKLHLASVLYLLYVVGISAASFNHMRLLKTLLTYSGAAFIGLALGGYVAAVFPELYHVNNIATITRCNLVLLTGIASLIIGCRLRRPAALAWWLGRFTYVILIGYFFWRTVTRLELFSFFVLIALIAEMPFAAMWWQYRKLFSNKD
jgi:hypothetical protein